VTTIKKKLKLSLKLLVRKILACIVAIIGGNPIDEYQYQQITWESVGRQLHVLC